MDFKNITSFDRFRKTFEASIPDEFSNKTGFAESLVGRGFFSLIRFFKEGINLGRLEYLKRKLENEYFAGWLRFCALRNINIKNGTMPKKSQSQTEIDDVQQTDDEYNRTDDSACEIFNLDYTQSNVAYLEQLKVSINKYVDNLEKNKDGADKEDLDDINDLIENNKKILKYIDIKLKIDAVFNSLWTLINNLPTGMTFTTEQITPLSENLNKIKDFLEGDAKICPTYHLVKNELELIKKINSCTNDDIKSLCAEILKLIEITNERFKQDDVYDSINEEFVTSKINTKVPIMQILGDSLNVVSGGTHGTASNKVKPYDYLKNIGINSVDEIDFKACSELWAQNDPEFKEGATELVSIDGVRKIQYAASRIIYKNKSYVTGHGEKSRGLDYQEDSNLRTAWERKVEKCKGEWRYFMNVEKIDPFKQMSLQESIRKRDTSGDDFVTRTNRQTKPVEDASIMDEIGLKLISGVPKTEGRLYVLQYVYGPNEDFAYLLCTVISDKDSSKDRSWYLYLGNIDITSIRRDKINEKQDKDKLLELNKYAASIFDTRDIYLNKGCKEFNDYFKISKVYNGYNGKNINSLILSKTDFKRMSSGDVTSPYKRATRLFYVYCDQNGGINGNFGESKTPSNTLLQIFNEKGNSVNGCALTGLSKNPNKIETSKIGGIYIFKTPDWGKAYFKNNYDKSVLYNNKNTDFTRTIFTDVTM